MNAPAMSINTDTTKMKEWIAGVCRCELSTAGQAINDVELGRGKSTPFKIKGKDVWHASAGVIGARNNKCTLFYIEEPNKAPKTAFIVALGQHSGSSSYNILYKKSGYWTEGNSVNL